MTDSERIIACVNALAGIPDPAAALRAAREALEQAESAGCFSVGKAPDCHCIACRARAALSMLTPAGEAEARDA